MDKNDVYFLSSIGLMVLWMVVHKMFLTAYISDSLASIICFIFLLGPIAFLEIYLKHITASYPYIRAIVRPHNFVLRFFSKNFEEVIGNEYNTRRLELAWPARTKRHGKVEKIKILFKGSWNDRVVYRPGRAIHWEYEIGHPQTEQVILYEPKQQTLDVDHTERIPNYFLKDASGDYHKKMQIVDLEVKKKPEKPDEKETEE